MSLNSVLNRSGVNNFNYSVSVHYTFIYSCIHWLYLIITLLVINGHVGIESVPVCIGQKEGKTQLTGCQSIAANHRWWCKHTVVHFTMNKKSHVEKHWCCLDNKAHKNERNHSPPWIVNMVWGHVDRKKKKKNYTFISELLHFYLTPRAF